MNTVLGTAVHAGACVLPNGTGLLLPGSSKSGKSTVVAALLMASSARYISDDVVWLHQGVMSGFGAPIAVRPTSPFWGSARTIWPEEVSERLLVRPSDLTAASPLSEGPVHLVVFPDYRDGLRRLELIGAPEAFCRIVGSLFRKPSSAELLALGELVTRCPAAVVTYDDCTSVFELCRQFLDAAADTKPDKSPVWIAPNELGAGEFAPNIEGMRFGDDVVVWNCDMGQLVSLGSWAGGPFPPGDAYDQLRNLGFLVTGR